MRAIVLLVMAGCGGGLSLELFTSALVDARCEHLVRCGAFATKRECNARLREANDPTPAALADQGVLSFDGQIADECLATIAHASCDLTARENRVPSDACRRMFTGTLDLGQFCVVDGQCLSQNCDSQNQGCSQSCCPGTCGPPPAELGGECFDNACVDGAFCDRSVLPMCRPLLTSGEACTDGSQCAYGLGCAGGTCKVLPREGEACPDGLCAEVGLVCGTSDTCVRAGLPGDACAGPRDCSPYYGCGGGRCVALTTTEGTKQNDEPCQTASECASRWCTGTCSEPMECTF